LKPKDRIDAHQIGVGAGVGDEPLKLHLAADRLDVGGVQDVAGEEKALANVGHTGGVANVAGVNDVVCLDAPIAANDAFGCQARS
jgi:hypothetical protein